VVMKGSAQWPNYCTDLRTRPQYDLDLYCPAHALDAAARAVQSLGYEPFGSNREAPIDHLPPMIRKTGWRPRGDYYDPNMPLTVELHFRLWDQDTEHFRVDGAESFWDRRVVRDVEGLSIPTLHRADGLSYSTWHLVRHLLRGDVRGYHVYELAHFLHHTAADDPFWQMWRCGKASTLVESLAFRLAMEWFECDTNSIVQQLCRSLPVPISRWFDLFAWSPLTTWERPNKDELFLHASLVKEWPARLHIARRRLFPFRISPITVDAHVPVPDWRLRLKRRLLAPWFIGRRSLHHARTFAPLLWNGVRWWRARTAEPQPKSQRRLRSGNVPP
jgi:hypothetical protein